MKDIRQKLFNALHQIDDEFLRLDGNFDGNTLCELDTYLWFPLADEIDDDLDMSLDGVIEYQTYERD